MSFSSWQALEVRHLRRVPGLDQRLVPRLHQRRHAAAQDDLLAEQVGLGLFPEGRLEDARAGAADPRRVGERHVLGVPRGVLVDGDERRHPFALQVLRADQVTGALRAPP